MPFFGLESEMALSGVTAGGMPASIADVLSRFDRAAVDHLVHVPDTSGRGGIFLANGGRLYRDASNGGEAHSELCSPETDDPDEIVRQLVAGDRLIEQVARLAGGSDRVREVTAAKNNVCYHNCTTFGIHENYSGHATAADLLPFLISRTVLTGAGGFVADAPGIEFTISPRVHFCRHASNGNTQFDRGIFNSKDVPLGNVPRLHVISGEGNQSHTSNWLKFAITALVVLALDRRCGTRFQPAACTPSNPVAAIKRLALDPSCRRRVPMVTGRPATAAAIQRHYLHHVEASLAHLPDRPPWAELACHRWRATLDDLEAGRWDLLDRRLDWRIKFALFSRHLARRGWDWDRIARWNHLARRLAKAARRHDRHHEALEIRLPDRGPPAQFDLRRAGKLPGVRRLDRAELDAFLSLRAELMELDLRFMQLGPQSLFHRLDAAGVLDHRIDGLALTDHDPLDPPPPPGGRAALRAELVREFGGRGRFTGRDQLRCHWARFIHLGRGECVDMPDSIPAGRTWSRLVEADPVHARLRRPAAPPPPPAAYEVVNRAVHDAHAAIDAGRLADARARLEQVRDHLPECPRLLVADFHRRMVRVTARQQMLEETHAALAVFNTCEDSPFDRLLEHSNAHCILGLAGSQEVDAAIQRMHLHLAAEANPRRASGVASWRAHSAHRLNRQGLAEKARQLLAPGLEGHEFADTNDYVRARLETETGEAYRLLGRFTLAWEWSRRGVLRYERNGQHGALADWALPVVAKVEAAYGRLRLPIAVRVLERALHIQSDLDLPGIVRTLFLLARIAPAPDDPGRTALRDRATAAIARRTALLACPLARKVLDHWQDWCNQAPDPAPNPSPGAVTDPFWGV